MPMNFNELMRGRVDSQIDKHYAEAFAFTPMSRRPNGRLVADPERMAIQAFGVFSSPAARSGVELGTRGLGRAANDLKVAMAGRDYRLSVVVTAFGALPLGPASGI